MIKISKLLIMLITVFSIALISCSKEGPMGPAGKDGTNGADGADGRDGSDGEDGRDGRDGNANVKRYTFPGPLTFNSIPTYTFVCTTTEDTAVNSLWITYLFYNDAGVEKRYQVPGRGFSNLTTYHNEYVYRGTAYRSLVTRIVGTGEIYSRAMVFRILPSSFSGSGAVDYNGYSKDEILDMDYETFVHAMDLKD